MWHQTKTGLSLFLLLTIGSTVSGTGSAISAGDAFQVAQARQGNNSDEEDDRKKRLEKLKEKREQWRNNRNREEKNDRRQDKRAEQFRRDRFKEVERQRFEQKKQNEDTDRRRTEENQRRNIQDRRQQEENFRQDKRRVFEENNRREIIRQKIEQEQNERRARQDREERQKVDERRRAFEEDKRNQFRRSQQRPDNFQRAFEEDRQKRRELRRRFRDRLKQRNREDLRDLQRKREIIRERVIKRYDRKLRQRQLEEARERLEFRRKRDALRARSSDINALREELKRKRRQKIIGNRGRLVDLELRDYKYRKRRYHDLGRGRYRNGLHIYLTPPLGAFIAWNLYMIDGTGSSLSEVEDVFDRPLAVDLDEEYSVNDVIEDPEIRRKVRSVNLDAITFPSGSSEITEEQLETLDNVAQAIANVIERKPGALFLIEGHTDATGPEEFNQTLSEDRAAAVKDALIVQYGIPEQNLIDVGYGEEFLKIDTEDDEEENRRVAIRNISPLLGRRYSRRDR